MKKAVPFLCCLFAAVIAHAVTPTDFAKRMKITFAGYDDGGGSMEPLTNFPVLVVLSNSVDGSDFSYDDFSGTTGYDLRFTEDDGTTEINYEIEGSWTHGGTNYVWVQVPELVDSSTCIYAYWGNSGLTDGPATYTTNGATWSNGYAGVWHFGRTNGVASLRDSSPEENHGINHGTDNTAAKVGYGQEFTEVNDNDGDWIELSKKAISNNMGNFTVSTWFQTSDTGDKGMLYMEENAGQVDARGVWLRVEPVDTRIRGYCGESGDYNLVATTNAYTDGSWRHIAYGVSGSSLGHIYVDGALAAQTNQAFSAANPTGAAGVIGRFGQVGWHSPRDYFDGTMDELRIATAARSADWIWAEWKNMADPMAFNAYGSVAAIVRGTVLLVH